MKLKDKIKSKAFWAGLIGTVFLILGAFGVEIGDETASVVINAVCSLLVMVGVVSSPVHDDNCDAESSDGETADEVSDEVTE